MSKGRYASLGPIGWKVQFGERRETHAAKWRMVEIPERLFNGSKNCEGKRGVFFETRCARGTSLQQCAVFRRCAGAGFWPPSVGYGVLSGWGSPATTIVTWLQRVAKAW